MVTREEIERYYAEKLGKDYDNDVHAVPRVVLDYLDTAAIEADENGQLYYSVFEFFEDQERQYATIETIKDSIKKDIDLRIEYLMRVRDV